MLMEAFLFILAVLALILLISSVKIMQEYQRGVRLRLGKYHDNLGPGMNFIWPIFDNIITVDLRTRTLEVPRQDVITKDNATVGVDAVIYYKVVDPAKVILEVENFEFATIKLAQTTLRSIIGDMTLDQVLSERDVINTKLRETLDENTDKWGVKAEAVEIKEIEPPEAIRDAMTKQMAAERNKRAMILEAEGAKQSQILQAEGKREATIASAEGERKAAILRAEGEAKAIEVVAESAKKNLKEGAMTLWQLKAMEEIGKSESTKFVVPMEFVGFVDKISSRLGEGEKKSA